MTVKDKELRLKGVRAKAVKKRVPPFQAEVLPVLDRVAASLSKRGIKAYLVGGCVRDALLGRPIKDMDVALEADAIEMARRLADELGGSFFVMDEANGVARVVLEGERHIDLSTVVGDIKSDLASRDFTIDAMAIGLEVAGGEAWHSTVLDPFRGRDDLKAGIIRALGEGVFLKDPARLMRAVRLACEMGFSIEENTLVLIQRNAHLLSGISQERIRDELWRILSTSVPTQGLRSLDSLGLLAAIIPELEETKGVEQPKEHFWNVFDHSIEAVASLVRILGGYIREDAVLRCVPWPPTIAEHFQKEVSTGRSRKTLLLLAGLLHDIAKPQTKGLAEDGRIRFLGHSQLGAEMVGTIMERLRFSRQEVRMVQSMVLHHLRPGQLCGAEGVPTRRAIYRYFRDTEGVGMDLLYLNLADYLAARGPYLDMEDWQMHVQRVSSILLAHLEEQASILSGPKPKLIDGHDLIHLFGMKPGTALGGLLEAVREARASGEVKTREEALAFVAKSLKEGDSNLALTEGDKCEEETPGSS